MLPKIVQKGLTKDLKPTHQSKKCVLNKQISNSNINQLKMLKQFLQEDHYDILVDKEQCRGFIHSQCKIRDKATEIDESNIFGNAKYKNNKENFSTDKIQRKCRRQSLNIEGNFQKRYLYHKQRFFTGERIKLNELFFDQNRNQPRKLKPILINCEKLHKTKVISHRIL